MWLAQFVVLPAQLGRVVGFSLAAADQNLSPFMSYARATVIGLEGLREDEYAGKVVSFQQDVRIRMDDKELVTVFATQPGVLVSKLEVGDEVVVARVGTDPNDYVIVEQYRLPVLWVYIGVFALLVVLVGFWRGFTALVGLAFSVGVLVFGIIPNILLGHSALLTTLIGGAVIVLVNTYLTHGLSKRTALAIASTVSALALGIGLAFYALPHALLFGTADSNALFLQSGLLGALDLSGILLSAIIIGTLGVLDDVVVTQIESVHQLARANCEFSMKDLFVRGMVVGRHHIAAVVNTLFLAYVGVALPLLLLLFVTASQPLWVVLNSEQIAEEIVRTLLGSATLILAVPLATMLAAWVYGKQKLMLEE